LCSRLFRSPAFRREKTTARALSPRPRGMNLHARLRYSRGYPLDAITTHTPHRETYLALNPPGCRAPLACIPLPNQNPRAAGLPRFPGSPSRQLYSRTFGPSSVTSIQNRGSRDTAFRPARSPSSVGRTIVWIIVVSSAAGRICQPNRLPSLRCSAPSSWSNARCDRARGASRMKPTVGENDVGSSSPVSASSNSTREPASPTSAIHHSRARQTPARRQTT